MPKFIVGVREVWVRLVEIEAENDTEAKDKVGAGQGDELEEAFEYSHTLDSEYWTVEKVEEN